MGMTMLSLFYSKKRIMDEVFDLSKLENQPTWLALSFNEEPKYGQLEQKFSYTEGKKQFGIFENYKSDGLDLKLSVDNIVKDYNYTSTDQLEYIKRVEAIKETLVAKQINATIEEMKSLTPESVPMEEKAWEWFRVSMDVLINAISKIDNIETILQYKLFWGFRDGVMTSRLLAYNLDIQINILKEGLLLTVFNFKNSEDKSVAGKEPDQRVLIKGVYNDFFNKYIEVLKAIRTAESRILS
jgi:hypothetical protein